MPNPSRPIIGEWIPFIAKLVGAPDKDTYFVGHSIGCQAIVRYLQTLDQETKIGGGVFVAGWYNLRNLETEEEKLVVRPWLNAPRDDEKIKSVVNKAVAIFSDNDPYVMKENQKSWRDKVGAKIIIEHNKGHLGGADGNVKLLSALNAVLEISK